MVLTHPPIAAPIVSSAPTVVAALLEALHTEHRLVDDLATVMRRQRTAVGGDDLETVDDTVFATHRLLATLGQARLRRRQLGRLAAGSDELTIRQLRDLAASFSVAPGTDALHTACDSLLVAATDLAREVDVNRRVLREALSGGEAHVRVLRGLPSAGAHASPSSIPTLLDRRA